MNPRWSEMRRWITELDLQHPPEDVVCGPASPDNVWWSDKLVPRSKVIVTTRGRLAFVDPRTNTLRKSPPVGAFFAYRGPQVLRFVELFGPLGSVLYPG